MAPDTLPRTPLIPAVPRRARRLTRRRLSGRTSPPFEYSPRAEDLGDKQSPYARSRAIFDKQGLRETTWCVPCANIPPPYVSGSALAARTDRYPYCCGVSNPPGRRKSRGDRGSGLGPEEQAGLALRSPKGMFVVASHAGHMVHRDDPALVVQLIHHLIKNAPRVRRQARSPTSLAARPQSIDVVRIALGLTCLAKLHIIPRQIPVRLWPPARKPAGHVMRHTSCFDRLGLGGRIPRARCVRSCRRPPRGTAALAS
jgi:hypothetical protein